MNIHPKYRQRTYLPVRTGAFHLSGNANNVILEYTACQKRLFE